ncbi:putative oxoglutarate iron-dependent oxygenase [Golovinomyces cichoracearum]|uniref:Putative oxoglutarate iron-dependent oxygenase n=1 Tax=Golovinomyces cichoracearum TaxID=62708 RepID=A0A420HQ26_9PEZI|nr:putative oxoglutarate iron-dependent oxygenase [Golovinomyces cichoracearum]
MNLTSIHQSTHAITTWTVLLYLTSPASGCQGGETVFYTQTEPNPRIRRESSNKLVVNLETGMLLLHKHGDECLLHEGKEVLQGEKWVIRTDICVSKKS